MNSETNTHPVKKWVKQFVRRVKYSVGSKESVGENTEKQIVPDFAIEPAQWKSDALEDFKLWLDDMPSSDEGVKLDVTPDTCDLYTLFSEFTALRQEIRLQNREQRKTLKTLDNVQVVTNEYKDTLHLFKKRTEDLAHLEVNIRRVAEKNAVSHFFDVRDSLTRGYKASLEVVIKKRLFKQTKKKKKRFEKICQGYEMAIRRFDKALARLDVYPVETTAVLFDPKIMKAVEKRDEPGMEKGFVIKEISCGFVRGEEVLRFARVIVAEPKE